MEDKNAPDKKEIDEIISKELSRRQFMRVVGTFTIVACVPLLGSADEVPDSSLPASLGYILVDSKKCQGCATCMIACSLINEGCVNLSLSRIQVIQDPTAGWPDDIGLYQCRQCLEPACVSACPAGAIHVEKANGFIRYVDKTQCVGCGRCFRSCPHEPARSMVAPDDAFSGNRKSRKCDLCLNAPYHWDSAGGGVNGIRACESLCPWTGR